MVSLTLRQSAYNVLLNFWNDERFIVSANDLTWLGLRLAKQWINCLALRSDQLGLKCCHFFLFLSSYDIINPSFPLRTLTHVASTACTAFFKCPQKRGGHFYCPYDERSQNITGKTNYKYYKEILHFHTTGCLQVRVRWQVQGRPVTVMQVIVRAPGVKLAHSAMGLCIQQLNHTLVDILSSLVTPEGVNAPVHCTLHRCNESARKGIRSKPIHSCSTVTIRSTKGRTS